MPEKKLLLFDRRRRIKRPVSLLVFGLIFIALPLINYTSFALKKGQPPLAVAYVVNEMNILELVLLFFPLIIAAGLLWVKKWGWYLFLAYAPVWIIYNLVDFFLASTIYNLLAVFKSFFGVIAIIFFTSKDISAPYVKAYPRGWRLQLRRPIQLNMTVNGKRKQTKDLSEVGAYLKWKDCDLPSNTEIKVSMKLAENRYEIPAAVVRKDEKGVGIAFRGLTKAKKAQIRRDLQQVERENRARAAK